MIAQLQQWIAAHRQELLEDLAGLIAIPSVSRAGADSLPYGKDCRHALGYAQSLAQRMGFTTTVYEDAVLTVDNGSEPLSLAILAHLDVVPVGEGWDTDPYVLTEKDGYLYGRGVTDDKGPAIASLYAMAAVRELFPQRAAACRLWLGTAEETGSADLKHWLKNHTMPHFVITPDTVDPIMNGESAKYRPAISATWEASDVLPRVTYLQGGRVRNAIPPTAEALVAGLHACEVQALADAWAQQTGVQFTLTDTDNGLQICAHGKGAHIGKPHLGRNGQTALVELLAQLPLADCGSTRAIRSLAQLFPYGDSHGTALGLTVRDEIMGPCSVNCTTCTLTEEGVVCQFDSRGPTNATEDNYPRVIDAALRGAGFTVEKSQMDNAHYVSPDTEVVMAMKEIWQLVHGTPATCTFNFAGSYAHFVDGAIAIGRATPGVETNIHKANECLPLKDLERLVELLALSILRFCPEK